MFAAWPMLRTVLLPLLVADAAQLNLHNTITDLEAGTWVSRHSAESSSRICRGQSQKAAAAAQAAAAGHRREDLTFIHIPRCAGTSIEDCTAHEEVGWGSLNSDLHGKYPVPGGDHCFKQHVPPALLADYYGGRDTFCVVRDPYERMISEFHFPWNKGFADMARAGKCNAESLNKFAVEVLSGARESPYGHDCHLLPQAAYVHTWDPEKRAVVPGGKQWCKRVIKHEHLQDEFNTLMEETGYRYRLTGVVSPHNVAGPYWNCTHVTPEDFTPEARKVINEVWRADFELLNFPMLPA